MLFSKFSPYLSKLEQTSSRLEITAILAELFKKASKDEIDKICYLSLGDLAPKYAGIEFNLAEKMMLRAIALAVGKSVENVQRENLETGDLGKTIYKLKVKSEKLKTTAQNLKLSVVQVYARLVEIANEEGTGSQDRKLKGMAKLLQELDAESGKYVVRVPIKKLRLGFADMTVLDALSWMETGDKTLRSSLEQAFNICADVGKIAKIFKIKGIKGIKGIKSEPGIPVRAAKATALRDPKEIIEKMDGKTALEPKFDGFRVQIHLSKRKTKNEKRKTTTQNLELFEEFGAKKYIFVKIFSRNLDDTTQMFPDVVEAAQKLPVESAILDGEAIAVDPKTGKFLPFQETVQRKRKHGVREKAKEVPLKVFVFDCLYLNGKPLLNLPFANRRQFLERIMGKKKQNGNLVLTEQRIVAKPEDFDKFFNEIVDEGLEGLMAKKLEAPYRAGARDFTWVKYKVGMKSELADTIDCVVMGYYRGKGKRSKFGIGAFLAGIIKKPPAASRQPPAYLTVSKIGTGLTDEQWREMYQKCQKPEARSQKMPKEYVVDKNLYPDVWCRPRIVVEIEADTITKSPVHTAGLALRFPRLKRFRDDKSPEQATTLKELKRMVK